MSNSIAIFASGSGTNAEAIIHHSLKTQGYKVALIVTNNPKAGVIIRGRRLNVPVVVLSNSNLQGQEIGDILQKWDISHVVLAGYLKLIPESLMKLFPGKIVNIHPALLPNYGGKGMYGMKVHESVLAAGEKTSGITIHEVNENYDEGEILFQAKCPVNKEDSPKDLAERIHTLEHQHYPVFLEYWVRGETYPKS